jgi:large repetitive protein
MTRSAKPHRQAFLRLEALEGREVPANLTVTFSPLTHTLTVVGDTAANNVDISGGLIDPTQVTVSSPTDTINGMAADFSVRAGVYNVDVRLGAGNDGVTLGGIPALPTLPLQLVGRLTINGGDGANTVLGTGLRADRGVRITNGVGFDWTDLVNVSIRGSLTVRNGAGGSHLSVFRGSPGVGVIDGSVQVTNGAGADWTFLTDLNVGGGVSVRNGTPAPDGTGGAVAISNNRNPAPSQIHGSVSGSFLGGTGTFTLLDAQVGGSVALAYGGGSFTTTVDGRITGRPAGVLGNLTVTGTGPQWVFLGLAGLGRGLEVGGNLSLTTGAGADLVALDRVQVGGATALRLGNGGNFVRVDDSAFTGPFALTTGAQGDFIAIDTLVGTLAATTFRGPVTIREGAGVDSLTLGGLADAGQMVDFRDRFVIHHGMEADIFNRAHALSLFGTPIEYVV